MVASPAYAASKEAPGDAAATGPGRDLPCYKDSATDQNSTFAELPGTEMNMKVQEFVKNFYLDMKVSPEALYPLYDQHAEMVWDINGENLHVKNAQAIKSHLANCSSMSLDFNVGSSCVQYSQRINCILLVVSGLWKRGDNNRKNFVQSFLLEKVEGGFLILNESLLVLENVETKQGDEMTLPEDAALADISPSMGSKNNDEIARKFKVCILHDDRMKGHKDKNKQSQRELPSRITKILKRLQEDGVLQRVKSLEVEFPNEEDLLAVHSEEYLQYVRKLPLESKDIAKYKKFIGISLFSSDGTSNAAHLAAGAVIKACQVVADGLFEKAFAIIRPPGHHAHANLAEGFCYLNNIAIGAQYILNHSVMNKILVVDYDVHHGNGIQDIFYGTNRILYFSTHNLSLYPDDPKKLACYIGEGVGTGFNVNVPLHNGFGDEDLCYVWDELLIPLVREFSPDIILVAAGYDAALGDELGDCKVSPKGFGTIVNKLLPFAGGKMVFGLEGGYDLIQLPICVSHTIRSLLGDRDVLFDNEVLAGFEPKQKTIDVVRNLKVLLREYWEVFREQS